MQGCRDLPRRLCSSRSSSCCGNHPPPALPTKEMQEYGIFSNLWCDAKVAQMGADYPCHCAEVSVEKIYRCAGGLVRAVQKTNKVFENEPRVEMGLIHVAL